MNDFRTRAATFLCMLSSVMTFALPIACAPEPESATVLLALGEIPERVATISISVRDIENNELATSATIAAPKTSVSLGVPAETPLELSAVARTNQPGPAKIGSMPAYVGRAERTIALGREQELVSMTVYPAGVLTVTTRIEDDPDGLLGFRLFPEDRNERGIELGDVRKISDPRSMILRTGRYDALPVEKAKDSPFMRAISPDRGIYVASEVESILIFTFRPKVPAPGPSDPIAIEVELEGTNDDVITEPNMTTPITVTLRAIDAAGESVELPEANVRLRVEANPFTILATSGMIEVIGLPATIPGIEFRGLGRAILRAEAELSPADRPISGVRAMNILPRSVTPGSAAQLALSIEDPNALAQGTVLEVSMLDARGLFASAQGGTLDLSNSDPWAFYEAGPISEIDPRDRGFVRRDLSRPSAPRALPVVVRATLTSTTPVLTLTSSIALPLLELE